MKFVYAQSGIDLPILESINKLIINPILYFLFVLATLFFMYGLVEFIAGASNQEKREIGKNHMIWGILGLLIMVGVFGIMNIICRTIGATC